MSKVVILLDAGFEFIGACSTYYNAATIKKKIELTTDQYILPLMIKEVELDDLNTYKLRDWIVGTIRIDNGNLTTTLEGKEFTDFREDYRSHISYNESYIEVKSFMGQTHLRETLKKLREEFLRKKQNASKNGVVTIPTESVESRQGQ